MKKPQTIHDLSALVTGIILSLNLPLEIPLWQIALGSIFAIGLVKQAFGGLGQNIVNPALITRLALVSSFSNSFAKASQPLEWYANLFSTSNFSPSMGQLGASDAISSPTTLWIIKDGIKNGESMPDLWSTFMGNRASLAVGEVFSIAIILGGIYLLVRKVIKWHIPISFIATVAISSFLYGSFDIEYALLNVCSGGLLIAAFFMASDYATSPLTDKGKIIFGIGCGLITSMIRFWGSLPEGASYSIIVMNILTPHIDRWTLQEPFGVSKDKKFHAGEKE